MKKKDAVTKTIAKTPKKEKGSGVTKTTAVAETKQFQPYDQQAWSWMSGQSILGAFSPILYIGPKVSAEIASILGRPINLEEAKYLVQPDGPVMTCATEGIRFQPVKYVPFTPRNLKEAISSGKKLTEIDLYWGGAFYIDAKENLPMAFSGSVWHFKTGKAREGAYEWMRTSPLVMMANSMKDKYGDMSWGIPLEEALAVIDSRAKALERKKKIDGLTNRVLAPRSNRFNSVGDAFRNAKHDHQEDHRSQKAPYKRDHRPVEIEDSAD
jgi:hypothetical protein